MKRNTPLNPLADFLSFKRELELNSVGYRGFEERYPLLPVCTQPPLREDFLISPEYKCRYRCSACRVAFYKKKLKTRFLLLMVDGRPTVYEFDAKPLDGQSNTWYQGRSIRLIDSMRLLCHTLDEDCIKCPRFSSYNYESWDAEPLK